MLITQRPVLREEPISDYRSQFVLEPLEPGFGYTLGNSMRRTLLSSIPGAAATSIKIEGVQHEFSTIEGVKEDIAEIILNVKSLVISLDGDDMATAYVRRTGPGVVTSADIELPAGVEIHNPDLVLATLDDRGAIDMELMIEPGRGYVGAQTPEGAEIGRIPVDSIYSPVLKVTYKVEATRVEQRTDYDRLILDVTTKPSILPRDAVASAGRTLVELFGLARELNADAEGLDLGPSPEDEQANEQLNTSIDALTLSVRSHNCLKREGIATVGELVTRSEADLLDIRNFGSKSIDEVKVKLFDMGLALRDSPPGFDPSQVVYFGDDDEGFVETEQY